MLIEIPLRLHSESRFADHWTKRNKRKKAHYNIVRLYYKLNVKAPVFPPVQITLTRIAPRSLDYDNLVSAFKFIRDAVADLVMPGLKMGRADEKMEFIYKQEKKSKVYSVKIEISPM